MWSYLLLTYDTCLHVIYVPVIKLSSTDKMTVPLHRELHVSYCIIFSLAIFTTQTALETPKCVLSFTNL